MEEKKTEEKALKVINIGLPGFCEAIAAQNVKVTQLDWRPPVRQSQEMQELLDLFL